MSFSKSGLVDGKYRFQDLVDLSRLQRMFETFSRTTGYGTGLLSHPDHELLIAAGWREVCTDFHRANPASESQCKRSNLASLAHLQRGVPLHIEFCANGLAEGAAPLIVEGVYVARLASGQVFFEEPDMDRFRGQAREYGYDENAYLGAVRKVPIVSREAFTQGIQFLLEMATILAEQGLKELRNRQLLEELHENRSYLKTLVNTLPDLIYAKNPDGVYLSCNPRFEAFFGAPEEEIIGKTDYDYVDRELADFFRQKDQAAVEAGKPTVNEETVTFASDGHREELETTKTPMFDEDGKFVGVLGIARDITARKASEKKQKQLEASLHQAEKLEAVGLLAGGVAHDFNNMLGCIIGTAELLKTSLADDQQGLAYLDTLLAAADRATDLTRQLLSFARRHPPSSKLVDVHLLLQDVAKLLRSTVDRRIEIESRLIAERSGVMGDASLLQSTFLNLGINASHAIPAGGTITIATRIVELEPDFCCASSFDMEPGPHLEVEVRDTGCGIAPEYQSRIFEPFFTTKEQGQGTGLGLAAAYGTVRQHSGAISVCSRLGEGASFRVLLPLAREEGEAIPPARETMIRGSGRVLVVEDEEIVRHTAQAMLEYLGYDVVTAGNGAEAVEIYRKQGREIDVVLLDMIMPDMGGRDCFLALKKLAPDVRVVLCSGYTQEEDLVALRESGLRGCISKPFRGVELSRIVHDALKG